MAGELGENMSRMEFEILLNQIMADHAWIGMRGHCIKYVRPHFDTRSGDYYGVTFETMRGDKSFSW